MTGVQDQIDTAKKNADAQAAAAQQAATAQQRALMDSAKAAADQQAQIAGRAAAESKASAAVAVPLANADVQLDADPVESATASRRTRRASYGRNYGGVSI